MRYVDVALTDLQREFQRARSEPQHLVPSQRWRPHAFELASMESPILCPLLNMGWRCSAARYHTSVLVLASIASPTGSPDSRRSAQAPHPWEWAEISRLCRQTGSYIRLVPWCPCSGPVCFQAIDVDQAEQGICFGCIFGHYRASAGMGHAASLPTLDHSSKGVADGCNRPGFMTLPGSSPALIAATAITPTGEMSAVSHGRCSVPTAWWCDRVAR